MNDVAVVCRELGCGAAIRTPSGVIYKPLADEDQKVLIQDVNCTGVEENLIQCEQDEDVYSCSHNEDAGAKCECEYGSAQELSATYLYPTCPLLSLFSTMKFHTMAVWLLVLHISHFLNLGPGDKHYLHLDVLFWVARSCVISL
nr:deleted in malignant brain tumors 1 protein [Camelus dromedarius]